MQVTIYDIAKMANVSASTVSRVVNNKQNVSPKTRTRILKLLAEHNYVPNEAARGLVMQSTRMIGILITDIRTTQHTQGVYYIERELSSQGYSCIIHNTGRNQQNWIHYVQELSQRKAGVKSFSATWKKGTANTGYQLQYALKKNFSGAKTVKVAKARTLKATVKALKSGKTYYVRVRAYKTVDKQNYYSAWSAVKRVKVK